ncbi:MAG: hypothetical protein A2Y18_04830 [Clostridiales bacterium GWD2_32_19]|nr:MAG: hypothetical protein A2Y18_04830 [Clostridiales bacterium GWD2_32_19]
MKKLVSGMVVSVIVIVMLIAVLFYVGGCGQTLADAESQSIVDKSVCMYLGSPRALVNGNELYIDSENKRVIPVLEADRTLVPVRVIAEGFKADVKWDANNKKVTIVHNGKNLEIVIGSKEITQDGKKIAIDTEAKIIEERTFVPLRAIAEALGKKVFYEDKLIIIGDNEITSADVAGISSEIIKKINELPIVGDIATLKKFLAESSGNNGEYRNDMIKSANLVTTMGAATGAMAESSQQSSEKVKNDYSETNVQVKGVDESDIIKTDGEYIYYLSNNKVTISKSYPSSDMKVIKTLTFNEKESYTPQEMYLDDKNLIIIGRTYPQNVYYEDSINSKMIMPDYNFRRNDMLEVKIFNIENKEDIKELRHFSVEGDYISSRKIGNMLYLISNKNAYYNYNIQVDEDILPYYRDSLVSEEDIKVKCEDMRYFPDFKMDNYMIVAAVDVSKEEKVNIDTYLGAGQNVYCSLENLYVSNITRNYSIKTMSNDVKMNTNIYKFKFENNGMDYEAKGEVKGTILNQYSMDEDNDFFRIATTTGNTWDDTSKNNVYVLDKMMKTIGTLEDIAPGEKIYSTRFMGNKLYMVTFKNTDPLFVIDLSNPEKPAVLGALKIPGFSEYLHPYDENHIIGFGKDTIELSTEGGTNAYYLGMKIAMFDVSDVNNPKEMFVEKIGDRGTSSELLQNPKALVFSKEKNLLAFPVNEYKLAAGEKVVNKDNYPNYGQFNYQGLFTYSIDLQEGFKLKGKITHIEEDEYKKSGSYYGNSEKEIRRAVYIKDTIYTFSNNLIKANDLGDMKEVGSLKID